MKLQIVLRIVNYSKNSKTNNNSKNILKINNKKEKKTTISPIWTNRTKFMKEKDPMLFV